MLTLLSENSQYSKLNSSDQAECKNLMAHNPKELRSWVEYQVIKYFKRGITIDGLTLLKELIEFYEHTSKLGL